MRGWVVRVALLFALLSFTAAAFGAPTPEAAAEAQRLDAAATKLAKAGATREALAALRKSQELAPKPATLKRIAALQREGRDFAGAFATLTDLATRFDAELKPAERTEVQRALEELRAITGALHVVVAERGARVEIDGAPAGEGPLDTKLRVNIGAHTVKADKAAFAPFEVHVEIAAGAETTVNVELKANSAALAVRVKGAPSEVRIDGKVVGPAPWRGDLPPGRHLVEAGDPSAPTRKEVTLGPGEQAEIELEGETRGRVVVRVEPPDAVVALDGATLGRGSWDGPVTAGPHEITVSAEGFLPQRASFDAAPGSIHTERIRLEPKPVPPRFDGVYAIFAANFMGSPSAHDFITDSCSFAKSECTGSSGAFGAELPFRVGYSFGFLGVEGLTAVRYDQTNMTERVPPDASIGFMIYRITVIDGIAVRFMPKTQGARLSTSLGLAWAHESIGVSTTHRGIGDFPHPSASGDAPMLTFDVGVLFGSTPGARFRLALEGTVEFTGDGFTDPQFPSVPLTRGTTVFLGPSLGVHIGH